jgi:enediyne biosynthesis protein E11
LNELTDVLPDLDADADELDGLVADLDAERWARPAGDPGWTVARHLSHLAATFRIVALSDPAVFEALTTRPSPDFDATVRAAMSGYLLEPPGALYPRWRSERALARAAFDRAEPDRLLPWRGVALPPAVLADAAMAEIFAHGHDIAVALGVHPVRTDRLRHVVSYGVRRWDVVYAAAGVTPPSDGLRFELDAPPGARWEYGSVAAREGIRGGAEDFCLLVTGRHRGRELDLSAEGESASQWLDLVRGVDTSRPAALPGVLMTA